MNIPIGNFSTISFNRQNYNLNSNSNNFTNKTLLNNTQGDSVSFGCSKQKLTSIPKKLRTKFKRETLDGNKVKVTTKEMLENGNFKTIIRVFDANKKVESITIKENNISEECHIEFIQDKFNPQSNKPMHTKKIINYYNEPTGKTTTIERFYDTNGYENEKSKFIREKISTVNGDEFYEITKELNNNGNYNVKSEYSTIKNGMYYVKQLDKHYNDSNNTTTQLTKETKQKVGEFKDLSDPIWDKITGGEFTNNNFDGEVGFEKAFYNDSKVGCLNFIKNITDNAKGKNFHSEYHADKYANPEFKSVATYLSSNEPALKVSYEGPEVDLKKMLTLSKRATGEGDYTL